MKNNFSIQEAIKGVFYLPFFSALIFSIISAIATPQATILYKPLSFIISFPLTLGIYYLSLGIQSIFLSFVFEYLHKDRLLQILFGIICIIGIPYTYKCTKLAHISVFLGGVVTLYFLIYKPAFMNKLFKIH